MNWFKKHFSHYLKLSLCVFWGFFFGMPLVILFEKSVNTNLRTVYEFAGKILDKYSKILQDFPFFFLIIVIISLHVFTQKSR